MSDPMVVCDLSHTLLIQLFSSLFTDEEIQKIRNVNFHDVLIAVTSAEATDIQNNVFFWKNGKNLCFIFDSLTNI